MTAYYEHTVHVYTHTYKEETAGRMCLSERAYLSACLTWNAHMAITALTNNDSVKRLDLLQNCKQLAVNKAVSSFRQKKRE